ncbi:unnamed protein product [Peronospora belbahrii]|uniref:Uncharacterized protein n=1 Tax=Peronospora belbahrii TaxID=622444 RepID=A0ABN8CVA8_9STRA|nr:unnamed protein product [Peronospora belbahrii]
MAFYDDGREENRRGCYEEETWEDISINEQDEEEDDEDALFKSLDEDEVEDEHETIIDTLFSIESMDVPHDDLVERLSWDAASQGSSSHEDDKQVTRLPLEVNTALADRHVQWNLISPCFETLSPRPSNMSMILSPCRQESMSSSPVRQLGCFEPEPEHEVTRKHVKASTQQQMMVEEGENEIEEEEEMTLHNVEICWSPDANSVLSSPVANVSANPFATHLPAEVAETNNSHDTTSDCASGKDNQQSPVVSVRRSSLLPRVPSIAHWRRQRAWTGVGLAGTPRALSPATLRARVSRSRNQSVEDKDDGNFSSDDEGYAPEMHRCRASETERLDTSQWRRARHMSISFPSHRLSANVRMSPAKLTKSLQEAKDKLNSGLHLLRSGSSISTVMSDESYPESPVSQEIKSAPAKIQRQTSIFSSNLTSNTNFISATSACTIDDDTQHSTRPHQLRAGVFRAAGRFNAASAEAARKLKSRGFRAIHLPRQKAASETEEEDFELLSTYPSTSNQQAADIMYE